MLRPESACVRLGQTWRGVIGREFEADRRAREARSVRLLQQGRHPGDVYCI